MANSLYITATEPNSGKSAITLGLMQMLKRHVHRVAFFHPIIYSTDTARQDHDVELILRQFDLKIPYEDTYACVYEEARALITQGKSSVLIEKIIHKYKQLEANYDFVLCQGTDYLGKNAAFQFELNAEIATNLNMPIALVISGHGKNADEIRASARTSMELLTARQQEVSCVFVNRVTLSPQEREQCKSVLCNEFSCPAVPIYMIEDEPLLGKPTLANIQKSMNAKIIYGENSLDVPVQDYVVAAMQAGHFLDHLKNGLLVVTPGDRSDIVLAALASRLSPAYPNVSGILLTGGLDLATSILSLTCGWTGAPVPLLSVPENTYEALQALTRIQNTITIAPGDTRKINTAIALFERNVDGDVLAPRLINHRSSRMTPMMFEFKLLEQARRHRMRIVLPEGAEERILKAAEALCQREVAEIILLGDEQAIRRKIDEMGLMLPEVRIVEPEKSPLYEEYVQEYHKLRKSKGITLDDARDRMADATYFATMMVYKDAADGMVSGSINTTAHTIRPAFEIIKTKANASIVSSVFLMCLKDRVLVFGDCAVNPNPTAAQLADIAVSSAHTARVFGIEPRVAMLSYSTGGSGKGADVDVVIEATKLAREHAPDLALDGPLQYDAAIDPEVARTKAPKSPVAGRATVFIFPDLNTGNNTYKAVQRAADAIAIGPVLQGLNRPVNDLSRGCTVPDIINTVAITAIQAQAEKGLITLE